MFFRSRRTPAKRGLPEPLQGIRPVPLSLLLFRCSLFRRSLFRSLLLSRRRGSVRFHHDLLHFRRLLRQLPSLKRLPIKNALGNPPRRVFLPMSAQLFGRILVLVMESKNLAPASLVNTLSSLPRLPSR